MNSGEAAARLGHLRRFAHWMDDGIKLPLIPLRVGLDPIIGLVPGLGDAVGAVMAAIAGAVLVTALLAFLTGH
jgi:hypothetical protein